LELRRKMVRPVKQRRSRYTCGSTDPNAAFSFHIWRFATNFPQRTHSMIILPLFSISLAASSRNKATTWFFSQQNLDIKSLCISYLIEFWFIILDHFIFWLNQISLNLEFSHHLLFILTYYFTFIQSVYGSVLCVLQLLFQFHIGIGHVFIFFIDFLIFYFYLFYLFLAFFKLLGQLQDLLMALMLLLLSFKWIL